MNIPQLSYQLNPSPAPLMASPANPATAGYNQSVLTLTASNATTGDVTLTFLRLDLPLGSGATDLLDLADWQTAVGVTPDPAWTLFQTSVRTDASGQHWASYLFHPLSGGVLPADNSWTFTWQGVAPAYWGVPINTVSGGPVACLLTEGSPARPDGPASQTLFLEKAPAGWFAPTLVATPEAVDSGGTVQLSWNGPAGASYQLNGLAPGAPDPLPNAGTWASAPLTQAPVAVFTLRVDYTPSQGPAQHAAPQQTVTVQPPAPAAPVINSFTGTMINGDGQPTLLLNWNVSPDSAIVTLSSSSHEFTANSSLMLTPSAAQPLRTTYTLTAITAGHPPALASLMATYQPVQTIAVGDYPAGIAFTLDGSQAWVVNNNNTVTVLDTANHQPVQTIAVGNQPWGIAFTPNGSQAWVTNPYYNTVTVLDTANHQSVQTLSVNNPWGIALTPDGTQAWVVNGSDKTVTVFDTATYLPVTSSPIKVGNQPEGIALTPDGCQAWVTSAENMVTVLDTATYQSVQTIAVGSSPIAIAFTPDSTQAWVVNGGDNTVTVLDTTSYQPVQTLAVGRGPQGIAFMPDGTQAWVPNTYANTVTVLALAAYEAVPAA